MPKSRKIRIHKAWHCLRDLQAFFWFRVFSAPKQSPRSPQNPTDRPSDFGEEDQRWKWYGEVSSEIVCYVRPRWIGPRMRGFYNNLAEQIVGR